MLGLAKKVFGSSNDRKVKGMQPLVQRINALEPEFEALTNEELRAKTVSYKERHQQGESLDDLLVEAFATVREAAKRTLGQRHYDVQLIGGVVLHGGDIAEMKTGEGKTLVATLPVYLNALTGRGVHVVTVNDYLAQRDADWMGQVYKFLGLSVGCIVHGLTDLERKEAYACDVTYGTNNEFGFDYLRDNMKYSLVEMSQRGHHYAIVDEVDSILIDEARTPLIISGPTDDRSEFYRTIDALIPRLTEEHYEIDEKQRSISLTEEGNEFMEQLLAEHELLEGAGGLYDIANVSAVHHVNQALRAHKMFKRDKDYIVRNDQVVLIDEFTGRMMEGRRLSEGLHQAIEAKENVAVQPENVTLASITFQNYFRLFDKLAGMTGTAATEASEFFDIYKLDVIEIPTNEDIVRIDDDDEVYRTAGEKDKAVLDVIQHAHKKGQPVLVGTASIDKSEHLSEILKKANITHQVLNARYHEQEASIIADAGVPGAVTIATNMAGRGTDIQLGGNPDMRLETWIAEQAQGAGEPDAKAVDRQRAKIASDTAEQKRAAIAAGGLYVIGSERHESRRIDNQLRGRTGRQGDPGRSSFFVSVEGDLMRIFAPERMNTIMKTLGLEEGEAIVHPWMSKALETAQKRVEQRNFEIRKNLLKYDDVINDQRKAIFEQRIEFMSSNDVSDVIRDMRRELAQEMVARHVPPKAYAEQWDLDGLVEEAKTVFGAEPAIREWAAEEGIADEEISERLQHAVDAHYAEKVANASAAQFRHIEKLVLLQTIDMRWREHLQHLDHLRSVVHLRGYGQRDPLNEFKTEAFALFERLLIDLRTDVTRLLMNVRIQSEAPAQPSPPQRTIETHADPRTGRNEMAKTGGLRVLPVPTKRDHKKPETWGRVGRNEACPCGSGKKYKHCHGQVSAPV